MGKRSARRRAVSGRTIEAINVPAKPAPQRQGHAWALAALAAFVALFYRDYLTGAGFIWEDALRWYYPIANGFCSAVAHGRFPFWSPSIQNGMPLYTDVQAAFFYPPLWLLVPFTRGGGLPFTVYQWYIVLHILMGGAFMYLFLARQPLRPLPCLLGAMVFCFAGFTSLHVIHVPMLQVHAWLPLELLLVEDCAARGRARSYGLLTVVLLVAFLAGFPQVMLYDSLLVVGYWLFRTWRAAAEETPGMRRTLARRLGVESVRIAAVFASVLLLAAVQILPTMEHWQLSQREEWGYSRISDQSVPWYFLIHLSIPNFFGVAGATVQGVPFWGGDLSVHEAANYRAAPWQYHEFGAYAGQLAVVALLGIALSRKSSPRNVALFFLGCWLFALWFMLGRYGGLFSAFYHLVPGVALFRGPARMACVLDSCAAVMVAFFVESWILNSAERSRKPLFALLGIYAVGAWCYSTWGSRLLPELQTARVARFAEGQSLLAVCFFAGTAACLLGLGAAGPRWRSLACGAGLLVLTFADLQKAYGHFHKGAQSPVDFFSNKTQVQVLNAFERAVNALGPMRFTQTGSGAGPGEYLWDQNTALMHAALESPRGYTTFSLRNIQKFRSVRSEQARFDIQNVGMVSSLNAAANEITLLMRTNALPRAKFYSRIKSYDSEDALVRALDSGDLDYQRTLAVLSAHYAGPLPPLVFNAVQPPASVRLTRISPECTRIQYAASQPGVIFLSRAFYPGWKATGSDSRAYDVIRTFIAFTGIVIPSAGAGEITLRFRPASFRLGAIISATTAVLLACLYALLRRRQKHGPRRIP